VVLQEVLTRSETALCLEGTHWIAGASSNDPISQAKDVPIKRHVKIRAAANPYDSAWRPTLKKRIGLQMKENFRGYDKLLKLWFNQNGDAHNVGKRSPRRPAGTCITPSLGGERR